LGIGKHTNWSFSYRSLSIYSESLELKELLKEMATSEFPVSKFFNFKMSEEPKVSLSALPFKHRLKITKMYILQK
jgi:hypothetical protein